MAIQVTEKQHFVPRAYLKHFANRIKSGHYNIMALPIDSLAPEAITERNTKSVCYEKNLYTLSGNTPNEQMLVEIFYAENLESKYEEVYRLLIDPAKTEVSAQERGLIISTIATMFYRVPRWQQQQIQGMRGVFEMCIETTAYTGQKETEIEGDTYVIEGKTVDQLIAEYTANNKSHQIVSQLTTALKLVTVRLQNDNIFISKLEEADQAFLTSDNPIIIQNLSDQATPPFDPSNIMKLPLDEKHCLMLMPYNDKSNLNQIVRNYPTGSFSKREELITNTEQLHNAQRFLLGNSQSLTRFLHIKDQNILLTATEQEYEERLIKMGRERDWFKFK